MVPLGEDSNACRIRVSLTILFFPLLRKRPQGRALLTCEAGSLAKYLTQKLKGGSICLGSRFKVGSVCHGRKGMAVSGSSKRFTISQNSATSWVPCSQARECREDILHWNHNRVLLPASHVRCLPVLSGCLAMLWL